MASGARQGCACLDTSGPTWTCMDTRASSPACAAQPCPHAPWGPCAHTWAVTWTWPGTGAMLAPPWHGTGPTSVPRLSRRPPPGAALSSWSFNEVNCIKSSVCPKCPSLREAAAAQPGHTPGAGQGATGQGTRSRAGHVAVAGGGGGRRRFSTFAIISLLPPKFTAYLSGLSASNLIKSGKL